MIEGIYYESKALAVGVGGTANISKDAHELHFWLKENNKGEVDMYYLKPDGEATSMIVETITKAEFEKRFKECSTHKCQFRKLNEEELKAEKAEEKVRLGEKHLEKKEFNAAKYEYGNALKVDGKNLKAHFGKGKAHMALGETGEAKEHFEKMAENKELYEGENKHLFNELGIELRKNRMYDESIRNYNKAIEIDSDDERLYYNIARAYKEKGNLVESKKLIKKSLELNPEFKEAEDFLQNLG